MIRTQVQLTEEQMERLRRAAAREKVSLAEMMRQSITRSLGESVEPDFEERRRRALAAAGRFRSGRNDISTRHDDYLAEEYQR